MLRNFNHWWFWAAANLGGIALFMYFAIPTWIEPELANEPGASGGAAIVWGVSALPVFLLFMIAHLILGFAARRSWRGSIFLAVTLLCWIGAFIYDGAHHGA